MSAGGRTFEATKKLKHAEKETGHEGVEENQGYGKFLRTRNLVDIGLGFLESIAPD